jgi:ankyrin repeat protein
MSDKAWLLVQAAYDGCVKEVKAALIDMPDPNVRNKPDGWGDSTALFHASLRGHLDVVLLLLAHKDINVHLGRKEVTPLHAACSNGHTLVTQALLAAGADVCKRDTLGRTALLTACVNGHTAIVHHLITEGAHVNCADTLGHTALDLSLCNGHTDTVKMLLVNHAKPGTLTSIPHLHARLLINTSTPFTLCPEEKTADILSEKDMFGRTALHYAGIVEDKHAYDALRAAMDETGVDTNGVDGGDHTAYGHLVRVCVHCAGDAACGTHSTPLRVEGCGRVADPSCAC